VEHAADIGIVRSGCRQLSRDRPKLSFQDTTTRTRGLRAECVFVHENVRTLQTTSDRIPFNRSIQELIFRDTRSTNLSPCDVCNRQREDVLVTYP
jgi:hypothetical protein